MTVPPDVVQNWTALGVVLAVFVYLVTVYIPKKEQMFRESFERQADRFAASLQLLAESSAASQRDTALSNHELTIAVRQLASDVRLLTDRACRGRSGTGKGPGG